MRCGWGGGEARRLSLFGLLCSEKLWDCFHYRAKMKQQRLITHVAGRGDELDPSLMGGRGGEGGRTVSGATSLSVSVRESV